MHTMVTGDISSVKEISPTVLSVASTTEALILPQTPTTLLEVLREWGHTWIWDGLEVVGKENWILEAIQDGTLLAVADGSYMEDLYPNMCSDGFVMECSHGRGQIFGSFPERSNGACAY